MVEWDLDRHEEMPRLAVMKAGAKIWTWAAMMLVAMTTTLVPARGADGPIRVLLMVGGHDYQTNEFHRLFEANPEVTFRVVEHPAAHEWLGAERSDGYDVIVLYDMWQPITEQAKADFVARLGEGKGLVALHHSLASYQAWDEYREIIGGRYHLKPRRVNDVEMPGSTYRHDVRFRVKILDRDHPITKGLEDFDIHDETYGGFEVMPDARPLLGTDEPTSGPVIGWWRRHGRARVVYIQLGHDRQAYENPNYERLVARAIRWVAGRE
jgi:uncharacterized protein